MRDTETPKAADGSRSAATQAERPRERIPSAHPMGLSAAVYSLRALPAGAPAVGASAANGRDILHAEGCHCLVCSSSPGEDWAAAALAGAGSFIREGLDLSGDEPYSFHEREPLTGAL